MARQLRKPRYKCLEKQKHERNLKKWMFTMALLEMYASYINGSAMLPRKM